MILAVDAINLKRGGGLTHLVKIISEFLLKDELSKIILFAPKYTLNKIADHEKLVKVYEPFFDTGNIRRLIWTKYRLKKILIDYGCNVLFVPGGTFLTNFRPIVTMSRNMLPIELTEAMRYGLSFTLIRLLILRYWQKYSFIRATGFIFLTEYSKECFDKLNWNNKAFANTVVIPHGVDSLYSSCNPIINRVASNFDCMRPFRIIYVSIIDVYKHQRIVLEAIDKLRKKGMWVEMHFVGPSYTPELKKFLNQLNGLTQNIQNSVFYHGSKDLNSQIELYKKMDCVLFASSCENLPNILIEGMRTGLPILSSDKKPMTDILGEGAIYFDPQNADSIADAISKYYFDCTLRGIKAELSYYRSLNYSWENCADQTFSFLKKIVRECVE